MTREQLGAELEQLGAALVDGQSRVCGLAYRKLLESAGSVPEVGALIAEVRDRTSRRILEGLGAGAAPKPRAAVRAWLWFVDGAIVDWLEHRDLSRAELGELLIGSLAGALSAAGAGELLAG